MERVSPEAPAAYEPLAAVLAGLAAELDSLGSVPAVELGRRVLVLQGLRARFDAVLAQTTAAADAAGSHVSDGAVTLAGWVDQRVPVDPAQVRRDLRHGRALSQHRLVGEALGAGWISRDHTRVLLGLRNPRTYDAFVRDEALLVEFALTLDWHDFATAVAYWRIVNHPDGSDPAVAADKRFLTLTRHQDGSASGAFHLPVLSAEAFSNALAAEEQRLFDADWADARQRHGDKACARDLTRTASQRRHDAFMNLILRGHQAARNAAQARPVVHIVIGQEILDDPDATPDFADPSRRCELVDGTPIDPRLLLSIIWDANLRRIVLDADSEILDLGRSVRCFPRHLVDAILVAYRGRCAERTCVHQPGRLQIDHINQFHHGGHTQTRNGRPLCPPTNRRWRTPPPTRTPRPPRVAPPPDPPEPHPRT